MFRCSHSYVQRNIDRTNLEAISGACGLVWNEKMRKRLVACLEGGVLYEITALDSVIKLAASCVLCATRLLNQIQDRIFNKHYILRTEHAYVQWYGLRHRVTWGCRKSRFSDHVDQ